MTPAVHRWGLPHAAGVLALKLAADLAVGVVLVLGPGQDSGALIICALSAASWLPVLGVLALMAWATSSAPLVPWCNPDLQVRTPLAQAAWLLAQFWSVLTWPFTRATFPRMPWRDPQLRRDTVVVLVGSCVIASSLLLSWFAGDASTPLEDAIRTEADLWAMVVFALVVAPVVEEVFFRGYLYTAIENTLGGWLAVLLVGLVFGLFHGLQYAGVPAALAAVTLMGLATTWIRRYTGAVLPCVVLHVVYNMAGVSVLLASRATG